MYLVLLARPCLPDQPDRENAKTVLSSGFCVCFLGVFSAAGGVVWLCKVAFQAVYIKSV